MGDEAESIRRAIQDRNPSVQQPPTYDFSPRHFTTCSRPNELLAEISQFWMAVGQRRRDRNQLAFQDRADL